MNGNRTYTSVFRFASVEDLTAFETSELRRAGLAEVQPFVEADATWDRLTGLEFWFMAPPGTVIPQPSRLRMSLLLIVAVFVLVLTIGGGIAWLLPWVDFSLRLFLTIAVEVFLMTYLVMPWLTRRLARWIYPSPRQAT